VQTSSDAALSRQSLRPRKRIRDYRMRDFLVVGLPAVLLALAAFALTAIFFVRPAPPRDLVMSTGPEGGAYQRYAAQYKPILAHHGVELREWPSAGAVENLQRLLNPKERVDVAFVQGGLGIGRDTEGLVSLGSFYYEPVWIFYRGKERVERLVQFRGRRIAVGREGSGTRKLATEMLEANGVDASTATFDSRGGLDAAAALAGGEVDAAFLVGPVISAGVWTLLYTEGARLMSLERADAYVRRFPHLSRVVLPVGGIDLMRDIPMDDKVLVSPMATIVAREDLHPALVDLLLQTASEVHGGPGLFQRPGEFPNAKQVDFPLSREAERYYRSGMRFLHRYLPFWAATFLERMLVFLIPLFAVLLPLVRLAPQLYAWRTRSRIFRWYGELSFLEREVDSAEGAKSVSDYMARLDRIEEGVEHMRTPVAFQHHVYVLREHIDLVRAAIRKRARQLETQ